MLPWWEICKREEVLDGSKPALHIVAVALSRVHANGNNVIVLINTILLAYYEGEEAEFQHEFLFELNSLFLSLKILDNDL